jgi:hypothetical protein
MDIENILPFIILGIYLLSLFGKKKKPQKEASAKETYSLKNIIQGIAKQLKEKVDAAARGLEQFDQEHTKSMKIEDPEVKTPEVLWGKKRMDVSPLGTLPDEEKEAGIEEVLSVESEESDVVKKVKIQTHTARLPVNLQRAVIWYEILAPPVALRDDRNWML